MYTNQPTILGDKSKHRRVNNSTLEAPKREHLILSQAMRGVCSIFKPEEQVAAVAAAAVAQEGSFLAENTVFIKTTGNIELNQSLTESLGASCHPYVIENDTNTSIK